MNFSAVDIGSTSITFSWEPPVGVKAVDTVVSYTLNCQPPISGLPKSYSSDGYFQVLGFSPATKYTCSVYTSTFTDTSERAFLTVTTREEGLP